MLKRPVLMHCLTSFPPRILHVIAYHYVREEPQRDGLKGMLTADFERQLDALRARFEMATLSSALAFLDGTYVPSRDLCLLTFDDGLRDHCDVVVPRLVARGLQGVFFIITACLEGCVAAVHKNHFLMGALNFSVYRRRVMDCLAAKRIAVRLHAERVRATYRWDDEPTAELKYLLNFVLPDDVRSEVLSELFEEKFGDEAAFSRRLYLNWSDAAELQRRGMVVGGHTHTHPSLARLDAADQRGELETSTALLRRHLAPQPIWPFSYPFGKSDAFDSRTIALLQALGYSCAFTSEPGRNEPGADRFRIRRLDPKDVAAGDGNAATIAASA